MTRYLNLSTELNELRLVVQNTPDGHKILAVNGRGNLSHTPEYVISAMVGRILELEAKLESICRMDIKNLYEEKGLATANVLLDIVIERNRQDAKWGEQNHAPQMWTGILGEEFGELCQAVNETVFDNGSDKGGYDNMRAEAIQVAAVAVSFVECLDRSHR